MAQWTMAQWTMALSTGSVSRKTIASAAILALALTAAPAWADVQIGSAAQVVNDVTGTLASARQPQVLRAGIDVFQNETIDTAYASASRVVFQDHTQLSVGPGSQVVLDRFVFDPSPSASVVAVSIAKGVARFSTGVLPKPDYQISTPACSIGVRGTVFTTIVAASRDTWVSVEEGTTVVSAQGVSVEVNAGQTTFVAFGRPPTQPTPSTPPPAITTQMDALLGISQPTVPPRNGVIQIGPNGYDPYGPVPTFGGNFNGNFGVSHGGPVQTAPTGGQGTVGTFNGGGITVGPGGGRIR